MAETVSMPKLGFDTGEGKLIRQVVPQGQPVQKGQVLAEVEAEKATIEVEAPSDGIVLAWLVQEGQAVPIGTEMVVIGAPGEVALTDGAVQRRSAPRDAIPASPLDLQIKSIPPIAANTSARSVTTECEKPRLSPIAQRMAEELGIDPGLIKGTGPDGRILKRDIQAYSIALPIAPTALPNSVPALTRASPDGAIPLTKLRAAIGRRMLESKATTPHLYITNDIDMGPAIELRKELNALLAGEIELSLNDFVMRAAALTLRDLPNLNASFSGDRIVCFEQVHLGMAVAIANGLLTVVIRDCDQKSLRQIAVESKGLAQRAREGKVKSEDVEGSTFTVSNLGMYDVECFAAIINPPESAILAISTAKQVPVVKDGSLAVGWRMKGTISADHRVTDGADSARFMQTFKRNLEEPLRLLV